MNATAVGVWTLVVITIARSVWYARLQRQRDAAFLNACSAIANNGLFRVVQHDDHYHVLAPDLSFMGERYEMEGQAREIADMLNSLRGRGAAH